MTTDWTASECLRCERHYFPPCRRCERKHNRYTSLATHSSMVRISTIVIVLAIILGIGLLPIPVLPGVGILVGLSGIVLGIILDSSGTNHPTQPVNPHSRRLEFSRRFLGDSLENRLRRRVSRSRLIEA